MAYDFSNFLQGIGTSPEDEYQKMIAQNQPTQISQSLLSPQVESNALQLAGLGQGQATNAAQQMQAQTASQLNEAMAAKSNLASQRDAQMQSTQAQAEQAQAQEAAKKQKLLGLVSMATGGFGLNHALGSAWNKIAGKAGASAVGTSAAAKSAAASLMPNIDFLHKNVVTNAFF